MCVCLLYGLTHCFARVHLCCGQGGIYGHWSPRRPRLLYYIMCDVVYHAREQTSSHRTSFVDTSPAHGYNLRSPNYYNVQISGKIVFLRIQNLTTIFFPTKLPKCFFHFYLGYVGTENARECYKSLLERYFSAFLHFLIRQVNHPKSFLVRMLILRLPRTLKYFSIKRNHSKQWDL